MEQPWAVQHLIVLWVYTYKYCIRAVPFNIVWGRGVTENLGTPSPPTFFFFLSSDTPPPTFFFANVKRWKWILNTKSIIGHQMTPHPPDEIFYRPLFPPKNLLSPPNNPPTPQLKIYFRTWFSSINIFFSSTRPPPLYCFFVLFFSWHLPPLQP